MPEQSEADLPATTPRNRDPVTVALSDFWSVVRGTQTFWKWIFVAAVGSSLVDLVLNLGPPYPSRKAVCFLTALTELVAYVLSYSRPVVRSESDRADLLTTGSAQVRRWGIAGLVLMVAYGLLSSALILELPDRGSTDARGILTEQSIDFMKAKGIVDDRDAVLGAGRNPKNIYIPWTVDLSRAVLLAAWLAFYGVIARLFAVFILTELARNSPLAPPESAIAGVRGNSRKGKK